MNIYQLIKIRAKERKKKERAKKNDGLGSCKNHFWIL
jgi:hypothetical protein